MLPASESDEDTDKMTIDEQDVTSESSAESSDDSESESSVVDMLTPQPSTSSSLKSGNFSMAGSALLGRAIFTPDSHLPTGLKRSHQGMLLFAVPYDPELHKDVAHAPPLDLKWGDDSTLQASPPKKRRRMSSGQVSIDLFHFYSRCRHPLALFTIFYACVHV